MAITVVDPFASFAGLFETNDIDSRALLETIDKRAVTNYINDIPIDVMEEFTYVSQFDITDRTVESGFPVSDSRRRRPLKLTILGVQVTGQDPDDQIPTEGLSVFEGESWKDKYESLEELANNNVIVSLTTSLKTFENLLIEEFKIDRMAGEKSDALFFTITFKESRITISQIAQIDPRMLPKKIKDKETDTNTKGNDQSQNETDKGSKDSEVDNRTLAKKLLEGLAGGLV